MPGEKNTAIYSQCHRSILLSWLGNFPGKTSHPEREAYLVTWERARCKLYPTKEKFAFKGVKNVYFCK
jgi:hypothetical protein